MSTLFIFILSKCVHYLILYRHAKTMRDYGKSIEWPKPPVVLAKFIEELHRAYRV